MADIPEGPYDTFHVLRVWSATTPEGRKALILETKERGPIALEMTDERIRILMAKLSALLALPKSGGSA